MLKIGNLELEQFKLASGFSENNETEKCAMALASELGGYGHTDKTPCASPCIRTWVIRANDWATDDERQDLLPYVLRVLGTKAPELEQQRAFICVDYAARKFVPIALRVRGFEDWARILEALDPVTNKATFDAASAALAFKYATYATYATDAAATYAALAFKYADADADAYATATYAAYAADAAAAADAADAADARPGTWRLRLQCLDDMLALQEPRKPATIKQEDMRRVAELMGVTG